MSLASFSLVIGVIFYVFGFPMIFSDEKYTVWRRKFLKDENALRLIAILIVSIAVTTLKRQWSFTPDAEGLVVIVAWITLIKGLVMAWWPGMFSRFSSAIDVSVFDSDAMQMFGGCVTVLLGALFTYLGLVLA